MSLKQAVKRLLRPPPADPFPFLRRNVLEVRSLACLQKALGWSRDAVLEGEHLHRFEYLEDLNDRRLRDAEVLGAACANTPGPTLLEIGTGEGYGTALMAANAASALNADNANGAPNASRATVHTLNIPPEEIAAGGKLVTAAYSRAQIGAYYRQRGLTNVRQIFANSLTWQPDVGPVDVAFVDGCHDTEVVVADTRKVLALCRPGSLVLWHDFCPALVGPYDWIRQVCAAVEQLYAERQLRGRILHLQDSWIGLYRVPEAPPPRRA